MIKKPQGYDEAPAYTGESRALPKGKYVCVIKQVEEETVSYRSGGEHEQFVIYFDIAEGEYKDFYMDAYKSKKAAGKDSKDWREDWRGVYRQTMDGKGTPWLKGIITSIERSNNFTFQWDQKENEKTLAEKRFGGVFRRRQFEGQNGNRAFVTELVQIRSVAGLAEAEVPEDELLPDQAAEAEQAGTPSPVGDGFMNIPDGVEDEGIPFM